MMREVTEDTMAGATDTVIAFLDAWDRPGGVAQAIRDWFTADTVWENVGMSKTTGADQAMAVLAGFGSGADQLWMRADNLAVAQVGDKVLTERVDHVLDDEGNPAMSIRLMGTFEVEGGKITAWRDYFDTAGLAAGAAAGEG